MKCAECLSDCGARLVKRARTNEGGPHCLTGRTRTRDVSCKYLVDIKQRRERSFDIIERDNRIRTFCRFVGDSCSMAKRTAHESRIKLRNCIASIAAPAPGVDQALIFYSFLINRSVYFHFDRHSYHTNIATPVKLYACLLQLLRFTSVTYANTFSKCFMNLISTLYIGYVQYTIRNWKSRGAMKV